MFNPQNVDKRFFYGQIIDYDFIGNIVENHGKYLFRLKLKYNNGKEVKIQRGGFVSKKEATKGKDQVIHDLVENIFCPFDFTIKQVADYWLYHVCYKENKLAYNTLIGYENIIYRYLLNKINGETKIKNITLGQLERFLKKFDTYSLQKRACIVIKAMFGLAYKNHYIDFNPAPIAVKNIKVEKKLHPTKRDVAWTLDQIKYSLIICKENFPSLYLPFLLSITLGTRISETISIHYKDIDFRNKILYLKLQMNYYIDDETGRTEYGETEPKTENGVRSIPIPEWVLDEIIIARAVYERNRENLPGFEDNDYICCKSNGKHYNRSSMNRDFKRLLQICGFEDIHWHDLRHIYATYLENNELNMKSISSFLGHGKQNTSEIYIAKKTEIYDCTPMERFYKSIKPQIKLQTECINIQNNMLCSLISNV